MSRERFTTPDGCRLTYDIAGRGPAVLWQHGLGAPFDQPMAVFPDVPVTRVTLACRGHEDSDLGPPEDLSIATFAKDALALLDHLRIETLAAAGGISLGAGLSLRLAAYHPGRVQRLILARPAWIDRPPMAGQEGYVEAGRHLELHGATEGAALFRASAPYQAAEAASPDNAKSLLSYFSRQRPDTTTALLARLPSDWPGVPLSMLKALRQPTLVIGNGEDVAHPLDYARELAELIPGGRLETIPSKSVDPTGYTSAFRAALARFLAEASR
jgi:pimeloyl-ACP methyl ester carboxylesterase